MLKSVPLAVALLAICRAQAPQPRRDSGGISGQVTSLTGGPVKNAAVHLIYLPRATGVVVNAALDTYNTTSDASGNFTFETLAAGQYEVRAEHGGYLRSIGTAGRAEITLAAGQQITGISIELTPEGRIEGTITDEDGEPAPEARVFVLSWAASNGLKRLGAQQSPNQGSGAPDGSFVLGGLAAGFYYVCADLERGVGAPRGRSAHEAYIPTYYPGSPDLTSATLIKVEAGAVIRGVDIQLKRSSAYRFRGKAVNSLTNSPAAGMSISLLPASLPRITQPRSANTLDDGSFELDALPPGEYAVEVGYARPPTGGQTVRLFAAPVVMGNRDVEDGVVRLMPGVEVDGKVTVEGNSESRTPPNLTIGLYSASGNGPSARQDTAFAIRNVGPDRYLPSITGLSPGTYVKAVRFGNEDVTGKVIDLTSGVGGTLEFVLAPNAADVSGVIRDSKGNPLPQVQVSLWKPAQSSFTGMFAPFMIPTDANGAFHFANLPPGEYRVTAWASPVAVFSFDFLSQFDSAAAVVKLQEGSHEVIDAPLIPRDAVDSALGNLR